MFQEIHCVTIKILHPSLTRRLVNEKDLRVFFVGNTRNECRTSK